MKDESYLCVLYNLIKIQRKLIDNVVNNVHNKRFIVT